MLAFKILNSYIAWVLKILDMEKLANAHKQLVSVKRFRVAKIFCLSHHILLIWAQDICHQGKGQVQNKLGFLPSSAPVPARAGLSKS